MPVPSYLLPYDFSPLTLLSYVLVLGFYGVALLRMPEQDRPGPGRIVTFTLGVMLCYAVMQTRFDYYSQYMFFVHRGQHLILHHLGPILIALSVSENLAVCALLAATSGVDLPDSAATLHRLVSVRGADLFLALAADSF